MKKILICILFCICLFKIDIYSMEVKNDVNEAVITASSLDIDICFQNIKKIYTMQDQINIDIPFKIEEDVLIIYNFINENQNTYQIYIVMNDESENIYTYNSYTNLFVKELPDNTSDIEDVAPNTEQLFNNVSSNDRDAIIMNAEIIQVGSDLFYKDQNGIISTTAGWIELDGKKYYAQDGGALYRNQMITFGRDIAYYMGDDGSISSGIHEIGGELFFFDPTSGGNKKLTAGWIEFDGMKYYARDGGSLFVDQMITFGSDTAYYMGRDGSLQSGEVVIDNNEYYFDDNMYKGIRDTNGKLFYYDKESGIKQTVAGWIEFDGKKYFAQNDGGLYQNQAITFGRDIAYYMGDDGSITSGVHEVNGNLYFFDPENNGNKKITAGWINYNDLQYYAQNEGALFRNQKIMFGRDIAYYMGNDGSTQSGKVIIENNEYYFDSRFANQMYKGLKYIDGKIYYYDASTGIKQKTEGWIELAGKKYYAQEDGSLYQNQMITFGRDIAYYMGDDGSITSGVHEANGSLYFFDPENNGNKKITAGWINYNGLQYYAQNEGALFRNQKIMFGRDIAYYMGNDGSTQSGKVIIENNEYYFDNRFNNQMYKGLKYIDGKIYYYDASTGIKQKTAGWIDLAGKKYYAQEDGSLYQNQIITFGRDITYYMGDDGSKCSGIIELNGNLYFFDPTKDGNKKIAEGWIYNNGLMYYAQVGGILYRNQMIMFGRDIAYYMGEDGSSKAGIYNSGKSYYYFNGNGSYKISGHFESLNGYTYYYDHNGNMANDWIYIDGNKYFFNSLGHLIGSGPTKKVIDISSHQGYIDWDTVYADGDIDMVILRCGYGSLDSQEDAYFSRNLSEVRRLGIPYSIYLYSYAENGVEAEYEAAFVKRLYAKYSIPTSIIVYYDLEEFVLGTQSIDVPRENYVDIVKNFVNSMENSGYESYVYSYTNYLNDKLSDSSLLPYIKWVAEYNHHCNYNLTSYWGWQYSSSGSIPGIVGNVDMNVWFK